MTKDLIERFTKPAAPWWLAAKLVLWPEFCHECGVQLLTEDNGYFCPACWERSPAIHRPFCTTCGRPHAEMRGFGSLANYLCEDCRDHPLPHIDRVFGAARYEGAVAEAVKLLKFHGKTRLVAPLAARMADFAREEMEVGAYQFLVPVPLHRVRQRDRGFNQSALLAEALLDVFPQAQLDRRLQRIRPTLTQSRLSPEQRRSNVRGAFAVLGESLAGAQVLLIDDVVTTAGTVSECARVLRLGGAARVDVFVAALSAPKIQL